MFELKYQYVLRHADGNTHDSQRELRTSIPVSRGDFVLTNIESLYYQVKAVVHEEDKTILQLSESAQNIDEALSSSGANNHLITPP